ncbi:hypothetical protein CANARDRAFT_26831 [[Candida] arabinofermentans NRRL YB-2248]|uniref:Zn(2)-C6 fungal-type domain-containing protein n=1 Tax=[Candida] arabinofermentans NRRL YB-2248 TaxID=983967 RepID=A0A1E4T6Q9_9ASCO|nr:hypothetical protein CANARDRAFT_26831 [[Candida] arabinofermentans NRRL YB-2248]
MSNVDSFNLSGSVKFNNNLNNRSFPGYPGFTPLQFQGLQQNQQPFNPQNHFQGSNSLPSLNGFEHGNPSNQMSDFNLLSKNYQHSGAIGITAHAPGNYSYNQLNESSADFSPSPTYAAYHQDNSMVGRGIAAGKPLTPSSISNLASTSAQNRRRGSMGYASMVPLTNSRDAKDESSSAYYDIEAKANKRRSDMNSNNVAISPRSPESLADSPRHRRHASVSSSTSSSAAGKAKRSRNGCLTCRQRKKKCCETRPGCSECSRLSIRCRWPTPGSERRNRSKNNHFNHDEMNHELYGTIKILRGVVDYKIEG